MAETAEVTECGEIFLYVLVFVTLIHERLKKGSEKLQVSQLVSCKQFHEVLGLQHRSFAALLCYRVAMVGQVDSTAKLTNLVGRTDPALLHLFLLQFFFPSSIPSFRMLPPPFPPPQHNILFYLVCNQGSKASLRVLKFIFVSPLKEASLIVEA